jgi:hypothetical protein
MGKAFAKELASQNNKEALKKCGLHSIEKRGEK